MIVIFNYFLKASRAPNFLPQHTVCTLIKNMDDPILCLGDCEDLKFTYSVHHCSCFLHNNLEFKKDLAICSFFLQMLKAFNLSGSPRNMYSVYIIHGHT